MNRQVIPAVILSSIYTSFWWAFATDIMHAATTIPLIIIGISCIVGLTIWSSE